MTSGRGSLDTYVTQGDGKKFRLGSQTNKGLDPLLSFSPSSCLQEGKEKSRGEAETEERDRTRPLASVKSNATACVSKALL